MHNIAICFMGHLLYILFSINLANLNRQALKSHIIMPRRHTLQYFQCPNKNMAIVVSRAFELRLKVWYIYSRRAK